MKKACLVALLLIPFYSFSQTLKSIDGFLSIQFENNKASVQEAMKTKKATLNTILPDTSILLYDNVALSERTAKQLIIFFDKNKAYQATFSFELHEPAEAIDFYNALVSDLNGIYGKGKSLKKFSPPYYENGGNNPKALAYGYADYSTTWTDTKKNRIVLKIVSIWAQHRLAVNLSYQDAAIKDAIDASNKAATTADY